MKKSRKCQKCVTREEARVLLPKSLKTTLELSLANCREKGML